VDISKELLDLAAMRFREQSIKVRTVHEEFIDVLDDPSLDADVVLASFSLHHMKNAVKKEILAHAYQRTAPSGFVLLIDVFLVDGKSREEFIESMHNRFKQFPCFTESMRNDISNHIRKFDFPARLDEVLEWCKEIGYDIVKPFQVRGGAHCAVLLGHEPDIFGMLGN